MATIRLHRALGGLFPGAPSVVTAEGANVGELIDALDARWPGMADRLRVPHGPLRVNIRVFVDRDLAELTTPVAPGSVVHVLLATAGG
ncbi:MAG: MoaD/ThiS family protein [Chloroflexota bacterium]